MFTHGITYSIFKVVVFTLCSWWCYSYGSVCAINRNVFTKNSAVILRTNSQPAQRKCFFWYDALIFASDMARRQTRRIQFGKARQCGMNFNNTLIILLIIHNIKYILETGVQFPGQHHTMCYAYAHKWNAIRSEWDKDRQTKEKLMQNYSWNSLSRIAMIFGRHLIYRIYFR